jgi:hypothetical protein
MAGHCFFVRFHLIIMLVCRSYQMPFAWRFVCNYSFNPQTLDERRFRSKPIPRVLLTFPDHKIVRTPLQGVEVLVGRTC